MSLFKIKVTFPQSCDYSFNTWHKHYIPNKEQYTSDAIKEAGLTGKLSLTEKQVDIIWSELEYLHNYLIIVYAYYYFAGKHSGKEVARIVTQQYLDYLLIGLRHESTDTAIMTRDSFAKYVREAESKTSDVKNKGALDAESLATFGVMTTSERIKSQISELDQEVLKYLFQRVWAAGMVAFNNAKMKVSWD